MDNKNVASRAGARRYLLGGLGMLVWLASAAAFADDDIPWQPSFGAVASVVAQRVNAAGVEAGQPRTRMHYRADLTGEIGMGRIGDAGLRGFGHVRFGQGAGIATRPTYTGTVDSIAYTVGSAEGSDYAIIAQAYLQLTVPLGRGPVKDPRRWLEVTAGKLEPFAHFDQNDIADNEAVAFMNNVFVHNPILDSGGDAGTGPYGFGPGMRVAYFAKTDRGYKLSASLAAYATGQPASFHGNPTRKPFKIMQFGFYPMNAEGEDTGAYRLSIWQNRRGEDFDGTPRAHTGWGLSVHQHLGSGSFFGRFGRHIQGIDSFEWALTLGWEQRGGGWGRPRDAIGVGLGTLHTDPRYAAATAADPAIVGFAASGSERVLELFYRAGLAERFQLTPSVQVVKRPGGDATAPAIVVWGLRARYEF